MRNKGAILTLAIALALVCLYQLSFTWKSNVIRNNAQEYASNYIETAVDTSRYKAAQIDSIKIKQEDKYLDSMANEVVYNLLIKKYTFREVQARELNFGLDLKGGMNIILEISVVDILKSMAANPQDTTFVKALAKTRELQMSTNDDYITSFGKAFKEVDPNARLSAIFGTPELRDKIDFNTSDAEVLHIIKEEAKGAIDNAFNIITTRIDQFGVTQPNIQRLETNDRILVDLPGVKNKGRVRKLLQGTANLEFWIAYDNTEIYSQLYEVNEVVRNYLDTQEALKKADTKETDTGETVLKDLAQSDHPAETPEEESTKDTSNLASSLLEQIQSDTTGQLDSLQLQDQRKQYPFYSVFGPALNPQNGQPISGPIVGQALFRDTATVNSYLRMAIQKNIFPRDVKFLWSALPNKDAEDRETGTINLYAIKITERDGRAILEGDVITSASQQYDQMNASAYVSMNMNGEGATKWARITKANIGKAVAIVLDDRVYSAPVIQTEITGGSSQITGSFTPHEAQDLANLLKSGKLPAPAKIIQETVVGPSLGEESVNSGFKSFIIAFIVILLYMVFYYSRNAGLVSDLALLANMFFIMGVLASLGAALTLPGIAGIVLTIGMSVDANVLIYERIREEVAAGKGLKLAVKDGYKNAYSAIIDANLTTLITGIILLIFGTGPIKGFATTLVIGICTSLFSAIFITRLIVDSYLKRNKDFKFDTSLTKGAFKNTSVKFIDNRKLAYAISGLMIVVAIGSLAVRGLDPGVDFTGGRNFIIKFHHNVDNQEIAQALSVKLGEQPKVITFGSDDQVRITTRYKLDEEGTEVDEVIQREVYESLIPYMDEGTTYKQFNDEYWRSSQKVGPTIADDIKRQAVLAIALALIFMFLYIILRFRNWQYGLGAVLALMHDALILLGVFSLLWGLMPFSLEIDQAFIAAILTVVGYSINDTVVVFDRIREYIGLYPKRERKEILNLALNSTLSRTFNTSISTFIVLLTIFVFGGEAIQGFTFGLMIGVVVGTYSSLFVATPVVYDTIRKAETTRVLKGKRRS